ncbi:Fic family protein [Scandinavium sp. TWS1a]|uniref:Fic family protein n=1 Tax=Scandinavium tedordense TaxID=2926521 RepID=UPI0021662487|nr:Fic family protein [Scandinavium tedordense]MCS2173018.1 Fic family protein [Scandinavium tedordense]
MMTQWIWQQPEWPAFHWRDETVLPLLRQLQRKSGVLIGRSEMQDEDRQTLDALLSNVLASSAIEDERLNAQSVRSSLARRLGVDEETPFPVSERSEGVASIMLDAIDNRHEPLSMVRLNQWHHWLFPHDPWSMHAVHAGELRGGEPMQVVSGRMDKPVVHFEAPPREGLDTRLDAFIAWFNQSKDDPLSDPILRAAVAHLWFVTLHPYDDGNGRLTRALTDLALAQADNQSIRLYAMSVSILERRNHYYRILEQTQKGGLDVTEWVLWFLQTLDVTLDTALARIDSTLAKSRYWKHNDSVRQTLTVEQLKVINRLLDGGESGFADGISASQYQKVAKVSKATATRHLAYLLEQGLLEKLPGGGRNTRYQITQPS